MVELNKDKVQVRYITGINKCLKGYPTILDILYESCVESADDSLFSRAKMENRYGFNDEQIDNTINQLLELNYIELDKNRYKIINTPWL